jgi:hypothetical protein
MSIRPRRKTRRGEENHKYFEIEAAETPRTSRFSSSFG